MSVTGSFGSFEVLPLPAEVVISHPAWSSNSPLKPDKSIYSARKPLAALTVPTQIATFSYDANHVLRYDDSSLRYFVEPQKGADLEMEFEQWPGPEEDPGRLDSLLFAYMREVDSGKDLEKPNVMTWRGMMTRIVTALYERRDSWEMNAMLVDGTVYLEDNKGHSYVNETVTGYTRGIKNIPTPQRKLMYTGYAFESYCTADGPNQTVSTQHEPDVNTNMQWCSIVQTSIGSSKLVLGGEVDCVRGAYKGKNGNYVELKTSGAIKNVKDERNFERKALKYWAQSYLLGIPQVVVGFRSSRSPYILETVQTFQTFHLPRLGLNAGWSATACLNWTNAALEYIRERLASEGRAVQEEAKMFRIMFRPGEGLQVLTLADEHALAIQNGDHVERVGFLPKGYWEWVMRRRGTTIL
ncbi:RAI1-domain-containing protein [Dacryopinax primogenitus]|uniref:Decapping nuclease n=1 Tax=Dacryopinax primogenitus (strain DJM 731) TaxID=1858805 RepID=M5GE56_DACPD|nr:RAI1-domain-containing protein [Dacryopinax primogenitus]EJU05097.1 RAI1-domain-containing protein [Dacryopinax primogenitus]